MNCPFTDDGPCYYRGSNGTCTRKPAVECLKPYRDGLKSRADAEVFEGVRGAVPDERPGAGEAPRADSEENMT